MKPTLSVLSCLMLKQASLNPQLLAALVGGGAGALAGGAVQGVRKLTQSRDDEERDGSPSVLKGMLLGGLGGAGLGYGAERMLGAGAGPSGQAGIPLRPPEAFSGLTRGAGPGQNFAMDAVNAAQQQKAFAALNAAKGTAHAGRTEAMRAALAQMAAQGQGMDNKAWILNNPELAASFGALKGVKGVADAGAAVGGAVKGLANDAIALPGKAVDAVGEGIGNVHQGVADRIGGGIGSLLGVDPNLKAP